VMLVAAGGVLADSATVLLALLFAMYRRRILWPAQICDTSGSPRTRRAAARQCAGRGWDIYCDPPRHDRRHGDCHTAWLGGCRGADRCRGARRLGSQAGESRRRHPRHAAARRVGTCSARQFG
jgi:hypothetical protein